MLGRIPTRNLRENSVPIGLGMLQAPSYANAQAERINRGGNATTPAAFVLDLWRHVRQSGSPGASYPYTGFRVASQVPDPGTVVAGAMVAMLIVAHQRRR